MFTSFSLVPSPEQKFWKCCRREKLHFDDAPREACEGVSFSNLSYFCFDIIELSVRCHECVRWYKWECVHGFTFLTFRIDHSPSSYVLRPVYFSIHLFSRGHFFHRCWRLKIKFVEDRIKVIKVCRWTRILKFLGSCCWASLWCP